MRGKIPNATDHLNNSEANLDLTKFHDPVPHSFGHLVKIIYKLLLLIIVSLDVVIYLSTADRTMTIMPVGNGISAYCEVNG